MARVRRRGLPSVLRPPAARGRNDQNKPAEDNRRWDRLAVFERAQTRTEGVSEGKGGSMLTPQTRRRFLTTLSLAGASGVLRPRRPCAAEGALETTSVRLPKFSSICVSPQYAAEELLRAEGFTDVPRPSRFPISPGRSAPLAREMLRRLGPRSPSSTKSKQNLPRSTTITGPDKPASRNRLQSPGSCFPKVNV